MKKSYTFLNYLITMNIPKEINIYSLKQHIPSIIKNENNSSLYVSEFESEINIEFIESEKNNIEYSMKELKIYAKWDDDWIIDLPHLMYAYLKWVLFHKEVYLVHSVVINDSLIIGNTGTGKTTLAINAFNKNIKIASLDKTSVCFKDGNLIYLSGTDILSVRNNNVKELSNLNVLLRNSDRTLYEVNLNKMDSIKNIWTVLVQNSPTKQQEYSGLSLVHQLYPYFLDVTKNDCFVKNGEILFSPIYEEKYKLKLFNALRKMDIKNFKFISGNEDEIINKFIK